MSTNPAWLLGRVLRANGGRMETETVYDLLYQIMLGLEHLHMRGIVHRDMKPQNVLVFHYRKRVLKIGARPHAPRV